MIIKVEKLVECDTSIVEITINSVFESLIFNLLVIIHLRMSGRQLFTFKIAKHHQYEDVEYD